VLKLAQATADLMGTPQPVAADIVALADWVGPGYSLPTPEMVEAVRLLAAKEGILLDPVYSGKAMAGLIALALAWDYETTPLALKPNESGPWESLANRLRLTRHSDPKKIEPDLMKQVPRPEWENLSIRLIFHGRAVCVARKPRCAGCGLADLCPSHPGP
jgi:hypothetical protein